MNGNPALHDTYYVVGHFGMMVPLIGVALGLWIVWLIVLRLRPGWRLWRGLVLTGYAAGVILLFVPQSLVSADGLNPQSFVIANALASAGALLCFAAFPTTILFLIAAVLRRHS